MNSRKKTIYIYIIESRILQMLAVSIQMLEVGKEQVKKGVQYMFLVGPLLQLG